MLSRRLVPALTSLVVVSGLLAFLSCEIDAKPERTVKMETKSNRPSKCCKAGFFYCPTGDDHGCDCCGASVKGTLANYKNREGTLKIDGLDEDVRFEVEKPDVDKALLTMIGKPGQFILKLKPYEYKLDDKNKPHGKSKLTHWFGTTYECENLGDDNGKMKDRTLEFVEGWKMAATVQEVQTMLQGLVPQYDPERNEDKRP
jgi:hypothetical protein